MKVVVMVVMAALAADDETITAQDTFYDPASVTIDVAVPASRCAST